MQTSAQRAEFFYKDDNAPKPNNPNHIGVSVLIECNNKLLLEHRKDSETWAVIGGGLWIDEELIDGVIRKTFEETGIKLDREKINLYKIYDDPSRIASYPDGNILRIITVAYRTKLNEIPKLTCSEESRELGFFSKEEIANMAIAKTHMPIIKDYLRD